MKLASVAAFATMVVALFALWHGRFALWAFALDDCAPGWHGRAHDLGARHPRSAQLSRRDTPNQGDLVASGPCRFPRHPICASICLFVWAGVLAQVSVPSVSLGALASAGAVGRMICEEHLLFPRYPDYREYMRRAKRFLPGLC
jgi:steroid 5-alpha reductase family enzyme